MIFDRRGLRIGGGVFILYATAVLAACSSSGHPITPIPGGLSATATPTPLKSTSPTSTPTATAPSATPTATATATATPTSGTAVACTAPATAVSASGGTVTANTGNFSEVFASGAFSATTNVVLNDVTQANLPAPLARTRFGHDNPERGRFFTQGAGNTYIVAFCTNFGATPSAAPAIDGAAGIVPSTITAGTQLNIALYENATYVDVGTATVGTGGSFASTIPTASLPGVVTPGTYLVYEPAQGTNTTAVNLGFALVADDSTAGTNGLQFVQIETPAGVAMPTPTTTFFPLTGSDLDGQSLTPDAKYGAVVDGGNTVDFFSGIPQHAFVASPTTVDVTNYGGDGDSIASLPSGDEVVVSADDGGPLAVISGILAGSPVVADTVAIPNGADRDGLVINSNGTTLLSRGSNGLDIYSVAPSAAHAGSTGMGTTSYTFTLANSLATGTMSALPTPFGEDGRDEMTFSPADPTKAVIAGYDTNSNPIVVLLSGLPNSPTLSTVKLHLPKNSVRRHVRKDAEPSAHRKPYSVSLTAGDTITSVTITPDGTTAYVATEENGIIELSGVNTGTLAQVGTSYEPTFPLPSGSSATTCTLGLNASSQYGSYPTTMGVLPDGKYLVADISECGLTPPGDTDSDQGQGVMLTIPIGMGGTLGAPVGQLNYVVVPFNDQMIVH